MILRRFCAFPVAVLLSATGAAAQGAAPAAPPKAAPAPATPEKAPATPPAAAKPAAPAEKPAEPAKAAATAGAKPAATAGAKPAATAGAKPAAAPGAKPAAAPGAKPADGAVPADGAAAPDGTVDADGSGDAAAGTEPTEPPSLQLPPSAAVAPATGPAVTPKKAAAKPELTADRVFADEWWTGARPVLEFHGELRTRVQLFHNFALKRVEQPGELLFPRPTDHSYVASDGSTYGPLLCTGTESSDGNGTNDPNQLFPCKARSQGGGNMRLRLNPSIHVSDNLRILTQVDLLDNLALGSTPEGYAIEPDAAGGYRTVRRGGFNGIGFFDSTQEPPSSGINGFKDSVRVKRVWGEWDTPFGRLQFGRMPHHWGLGMVYNSGNGIDDDAQTTVDRLMVTTGIQSLDLYVSGAWDFANEGASSSDVRNPAAEPYDAAQHDDVDQYLLSVYRKTSEQLTQHTLSNHGLVLNGGLQVMLRRQLLANDSAGNAASGAYVPSAFPSSLSQQNRDGTTGFVRRNAVAWIPDLWLQLMYEKFRFEAEIVTIQGKIENTANRGSNYSDVGGSGYRLNMWGLATEIEQKLVEDKLKLGFKFGYASGDSDVASTQQGAGGLVPALGEEYPGQLGDNTISNFAFHPSYRVDLILHRNILSRVTSSYYFRPSVEYDFIHNKNGERLGGNIAGIWTRSANFMQTPGHGRDLGVEVNARLFYQSKDGALNDGLKVPGGFFTMVEYGILFPLGGLGYQPDEATRVQAVFNGSRQSTETGPAQMVRWFGGIIF